MGTSCQCRATMYRICCHTGYATQYPGDREYASLPRQCMLSVTCQGMDTLCRVCSCAGSECIYIYIYIYCQVSGEYNNLRVSIANALLRWYRSVQDVLPHRVCDLLPWERGVRMRTLPAYVIRCLRGYGYPAHGMWVCRLCRCIHFLY